MEGASSTVSSVLVGSAFLTGFALAWGATDYQLGLLGAIPFLGSLFQVAGAWLADRWPEHRRRSVALLGLLSRSTWFAIALVPLLLGDTPSSPMVAILWLYALYQAAYNASGPGWVAWMAVLVPQRLRGRYLGRRNLIMEGVSITTLLAAGAAIDAFRAAGHERDGFLILQLVAGASGLACYALIIRQPDPGYHSTPPEISFRYVLTPLLDSRFRKLVAFNVCWLAGMNIGLPFYNAHLLKNMQWDFKGMALLGLASSVAAMLMSPVWGRLADRHGYKPVLTLCSLGMLHLPLYYVFCPWNWHWPIYVSNTLSGVFASGFTLAMFSLTLEGLPAERRAMGSAMLAASAGPAVFLSGALSGRAAEMLASLHWQFGALPVANYQLLFLASMLLRLPTLVLLRRIHEPDARRARDVLRSWVSAPAE